MRRTTVRGPKFNAFGISSFEPRTQNFFARPAFPARRARRAAYCIHSDSIIIKFDSILSWLPWHFERYASRQARKKSNKLNGYT